MSKRDLFNNGLIVKFLLSLNHDAKQKFLDEIKSFADDRNVPLDKAFTFWIIEKSLNISDPSHVDEVIEISDHDNSDIDFFHVNEDSVDGFICWGQTKFSEKLDHVVTEKEFTNFVATFDTLESPPVEANQVFKTKCNDFADYKHRLPKRMILAVTGELSLEVKELLNDPEYIHRKDEDTEWIIWDLSLILQHVVVPTTLPLSVTFDSLPLEKRDPDTGKNSLIGYVLGKEIVRICSNPENRDRIFLENPREHLGRTATNHEISSTLKDNKMKKQFWKLNNGITATCSKISYYDLKADFENFKIVNGRQTSWALVKNKEFVDDAVSVQLIVHEALDSERKIISKATNTQNPIKPVDLITNDPLLRKLDIDFQKHAEWYFEIQRGGFNSLEHSKKTAVTKRRTLEKESMVRRFWAYKKKPAWAIRTSEKQLFLIDENVNDTFTASHAVDFIIPHILYQSLDALDKSWKKDSNKKDSWTLIHKRVVKFYVLALIAHTIEQMVPETKKIILQKIYDTFSKLKKDDNISSGLSDIAYMGFIDFRILLNEITSERFKDGDQDERIKNYLISEDGLFERLLRHKKLKLNRESDQILKALEKLR